MYPQLQPLDGRRDCESGRPAQVGGDGAVADDGSGLRGAQIRQGAWGSVGVHAGPDPWDEHGRPHVFPLYAKAQELDLAISVHVAVTFPPPGASPGTPCTRT